MEACSPGTVGGNFPAEGSGGPPDTSSELSTVSFLSLHRRKLQTKVSCAEFEKHQWCGGVSPSVSGGWWSVSRKHVQMHTQTHTCGSRAEKRPEYCYTRPTHSTAMPHTHTHLYKHTLLYSLPLSTLSPPLPFPLFPRFLSFFSRCIPSSCGWPASHACSLPPPNEPMPASLALSHRAC